MPPIGPDIDPPPSPGAAPKAAPAAPARPAFAPRPRNSPLLGAAFMISAAMLFAVLNGLVRYGAELGYHPFQIGFLRSLFAFLAMLPIIAPVLRREGPVWLATRRPGLFLARALAATVGVLAWITAVSLMPMAEATALNFTAPLFATAGSALILHEVVRARRWTAIAVGFVGVLIIVRPGMAALQPGALAAILAALGMASAALMIKTLTRSEPMPRIVLYTSLGLTLGTAVPAAVVWQPMTVEMWAVGIGLGLTGAVSQMGLTKAFEMADASVVLPFDYARLPFAALVGWVFFGQTSDLLTWAGALVIAGAAFYVARREHQIASRGPRAG